MTRVGDWIQTFSGVQFFPLDPRPEEINIIDIAHALAHQCRYGGHSKVFYSVAEHCVHLHDYALGHNMGNIAFSTLMHDAAEAYLVDVPRPIKNHLSDYKRIEIGLEEAIFNKFGLPFPNPPETMVLDSRILTDERLQLMADPPIAWSNEREPLGITLNYWTPRRAEKEFLKRFKMHWNVPVMISPVSALV